MAMCINLNMCFHDLVPMTTPAYSSILYVYQEHLA